MSAIQKIIDSESSVKELKLKYNKTINSVLNIYCARLQAEDRKNIHVATLPTLHEFQNWFALFQKWFHVIKSSKVPGVKTASRIKIALFIAAASEVWDDPEEVSENSWRSIEIVLLQGQSKIKSFFNGFILGTPKGKWNAQANQITNIKDLCKIIKDNKF